MGKAEEYIQGICNTGDWLTPGEAREAVRIEREEVIEKAVKWLNNFYSEDRHCFLVKEDIDAFKQAMEK